MKSIYDILSEYQMFRNLRPARLNYISVNSRKIRLGKGDFLERNRKTVYFLFSGKVKICELDPHGDEVIKYILTEGNFFGESTNSFCYHGSEFAKSTAGHTEVVAMSKLLLDELLEIEPEFSLLYSRQILKKCATIENQLRTLMLKDTKERLLRFLQLMAQNEGIKVDDKLVVSNYLTHGEIASLIGATRVTVTKFLSELRVAGNLSYNRREFQLPNTNQF